MEYRLINTNQQLDLGIKYQILVNRGIKLEDIEHYLNVSKDDVLSPDSITNIRQACEIILKHLHDDKKILVQVDSDCDGYCSAACFMNYLFMAFPSIVQSKFCYVFHTGKQHGIDIDAVDDSFGLVIAPDSSSNDYEIHEKLQTRGIDVVVIDHHQAERISEYACVVNNQLCDYPTKSLCGAGMVYKVCQYMDKFFGFDNADKILDLVALATIADMMDLRDFETRYIVEYGLTNIKNPFLTATIEKNNYSLGSGEITPIGIAFYVAPLCNAVTRIGTMEEKRILFESMLTWRAYEEIPSTKRGCQGQTEQLVEQAVRNCTNIKNRQKRGRDSSLEIIEDLIAKDNLTQHKVLLIKLDGIPIEKGLTGLIANQIMSKYQQPVAILNKIILDNGQINWEGSARGCNNSKLTDFRGLVRDSGLAYLAEGHPQACGIGIADENIDAFISYTDAILQDVTFEPSYKVDFIWPANDFKSKDILEIASLKKYWGQELDEALIAIEGVNVTSSNITLMSKDKNPTLKITLPNGTSLIKFKSNEEEYQELYSNSGCVTINVVGRCEENRFNGMVTPQILVEKYEIINRQEYYF